MSARSKYLSIGLPVLAALALTLAFVSISQKTPKPASTEPRATPATRPAESDSSAVAAAPAQ